jgi:hypothetical protein
MCSSRVHRSEHPSFKEIKKVQLEAEFFARAQYLKKPEQLPDTPDWRALIVPPPVPEPHKFEVQVDLLGHHKTWKVNSHNAWDQITSRSGLDPKTTMVYLNDKEWTGERPIHPGDKVAFKTAVLPTTPTPKGETFQVCVRADSNPRMCTLLKDHEFEDFSAFIL